MRRRRRGEALQRPSREGGARSPCSRSLVAVLASPVPSSRLPLRVSPDRIAQPHAFPASSPALRARVSESFALALAGGCRRQRLPRTAGSRSEGRSPGPATAPRSINNRRLLTIVQPPYRRCRPTTLAPEIARFRGSIPTTSANGSCDRKASPWSGTACRITTPPTPTRSAGRSSDPEIAPGFGRLRAAIRRRRASWASGPGLRRVRPPPARPRPSSRTDPKPSAPRTNTEEGTNERRRGPPRVVSR